MIRLLFLSGVRYFASHRLQLVMSVAGIAVGVAMVTGVDVATESSRRAFRLSAETISGSATHQLTGPTRSLSEDIYRQLRIDLGVRQSTPIVEGYVVAGGGTFRLLGIDPLAGEVPGASLEGFPDPGRLMARRGAAIVSEDVADLWDRALGDTLRVSASGKESDISIAGIVRPAESATQGWIDLIVTDISTAQEVLGMAGRLSRIDLRVGEEEAMAIRDALGSAVLLERPESRTESLAGMTRAFETNLQALSYLALVVGMFLIFNIMSFSVVQRRPVYSRLRAAGVRRRLITGAVLVEAATLGIVGTAIGTLLGAGLGQALVHLVTRAMNDLYFVVNVRDAGLGGLEVGRSLLVGVGATLVAAWIPARQASRTQAVSALRRSDEEARFSARIPYNARLGVAVGVAGLILMWLPSGVSGGYAALLCVIVAFSLVAPYFTRAIVGLADKLPLPLQGRMAVGGIRTQLSRSSVATIALSVSVAAAIGVGLMVQSFRGTVQDWLDMTLQADVYVQTPAVVMRQGGGELDPSVASLIRAMPSVRSAHGVRRADVATSIGGATLVAIDFGAETQDAYRFVDAVGSPDQIWAELAAGAVFVSEPFAFRFKVGPGDRLEISTSDGPRAVPIAAIYVDYGSDQGIIIADRSRYAEWFQDEAVNGLALTLIDGADPVEVAAEVRRLAQPYQSLIVRSNASLRDASLEIFDQTFAITWVLRALAVFVSVIGVVSALAALQLERAWEYAVQRAIGLRRQMLSRTVVLQSAMMGAIAGLLAIPLGIALAGGLVYVINRRSFGWTLDLAIDPGMLAQALFVSIGAAILGALIPAWSIGRASLATRLRRGDG